jgi:hypothetical protein
MSWHLCGFFGSFHETAKVVNSLSGETLCIPVCGSTNCQLEFERSRFFVLFSLYDRGRHISAGHGGGLTGALCWRGGQGDALRLWRLYPGHPTL